MYVNTFNVRDVCIYVTYVYVNKYKLGHVELVVQLQFSRQTSRMACIHIHIGSVYKYMTSYEFNKIILCTYSDILYIHVYL